MIPAEGEIRKKREKSGKLLRNIRIQNEDKHQIEVKAEFVFRSFY